MIYVLVILFALGVLVQSIYNLSVYVILVLLISLGGIFIFSLYTKRIFIFLLLLFFVLGVVRVESVGDYSSTDLEYLVNRHVSIKGEVVIEPEDRESRQRVVIGKLSINELDYPDFNILVWTDLGNKIGFRDRVTISGFLEIPENFETDSGRIFKYQDYLSKDDIYLELTPTSFEIESFEGISLRRKLSDLKSWFVERMGRVLPEPESSLAGGILLGEKQSLGPVWQDRFQDVGLTHIVVLSGYNISIVVGVVLFLLSSLSLVVSSIISIIGIILFALLVGGGATVIRASVMASILILTRYFNRPYDALRALFIAGALMIFINPKILVHDLSFQLSFFATLGIILFMPRAEKMFSRITKKFGLREIVATTFSAQLYVLPWIIYSIGKFSIVSFISNILVLPTVPLAMLFSFVGGLIPVSIIALPAHLLLSYELWVTEMLAKTPYASVDIPALPLWLIIFMYLGVFYLTFRKKLSATSQFIFKKKSST